MMRSSTDLDQIHLAANGFSASRSSAAHASARRTNSVPGTPAHGGSGGGGATGGGGGNYVIPFDAISIDFKLGNGEFGVVQQGVWTNEEGERIQVAIKCLSKERMQNGMADFLKEASMMHDIHDEHVVKLFGVVLDPKQSLMLVTELAPLRSLLECLKEPSLRSSFPVHVLCQFAIQIASGMAYLETNRLIHRDLAARNVLVFAKDKVKISDFGLSRALGVGKDYYQTNFNVNLKLPIAWCAPECINFLRFTSFSDVWAYGVTLWEMFSYGFAPWAALTGQQILTAIDEPNFQRLEQPDCCPKEHYAIMRKTWEAEPKSRPTFALLLELMKRIEPEVRRATQDFPDPEPRKDFLFYRTGDVITVLDKKPSGAPLWNMWKGSIGGGKTGLFNPDHTQPYSQAAEIEMHRKQQQQQQQQQPRIKLPKRKKKFADSGTPSLSMGRSSQPTSPTSRTLRGPAGGRGGGLTKAMISLPKGDLVHKTHVGIGGDVFGDVNFLGDQSNTQRFPQSALVKPYDSSKDLLYASQSMASISTVNSTGEIFSDKAPLINKNRSGSSSPASPTTPTGDWGPALKVDERSASPSYQEVEDDEMNFDLGPSFMDEVLKALNSSENGDSSPPLKTPTTVSFAFPKSPPPPPGVPPPDTPTPTNSMGGGDGGHAGGGGGVSGGSGSGGSQHSSGGGEDPDSLSMAPSEISYVDSQASDSEPLIKGRGGRKFDFLERRESDKANKKSTSSTSSSSGQIKPMSKADAKFLDDAIVLAESMAKQSLQEVDARGKGSGSDCSDDSHGGSGSGGGGKDQSPKSRKRFSQILKKSNSTASSENRTFCNDNQRSTTLDEDLTPEAQEAYNMLVGSLKKKDRKQSYKNSEHNAQIELNATSSSHSFQPPFSPSFTSSTQDHSTQKTSIVHPVMQHPSHPSHSTTHSALQHSTPPSHAVDPHFELSHQQKSQPPRSLPPPYPAATAAPSTPPPAPRDPTKNPPLFSSTSSRDSIGSRSQSLTADDNPSSPLKMLKDGAWKLGSRGSVSRQSEFSVSSSSTADPYGNDTQPYGYTSFEAADDDDLVNASFVSSSGSSSNIVGSQGSNVVSNGGSGNLNNNYNVGSRSGSSSRSKTPPHSLEEGDGLEKISGALTGSITSLPSVREDASSSSSSSLNLSVGNNPLPLPPRKAPPPPSTTSSTTPSAVTHVNSAATKGQRGRKIPMVFASDNMLRMAGLSHGSGTSTPDFPKKKSFSLEPSGDNKSGSDNDSTNNSHSSHTSLTGPDYAHFPAPGGPAPFQANAAFFNAISSEDLHSPTTEETPSPPGLPSSAVGTSVTSASYNITPSPEVAPSNLEVWEWQC